MYIYNVHGWFILGLSRYVCVGNSLPELALTSVQILYWVTQSHKAGRDVVTTIVSDKVRLLDFLLYVASALMAEWLRRWTRNSMGSARAGSNPAQCVHASFFLPI